MTNESITGTQPIEILSHRPRMVRRARRLALLAWRLPKFSLLLLLLVLVIPAIFADILAPYGPLEAPGGIRERLQPPAFAGGSPDHLLGKLYIFAVKGLQH